MRLYDVPFSFPKAANHLKLAGVMSFAQSQSPSPDRAKVAAHELASQLAARLCHDFMSPTSAMVSGLDLLDDPTAKDMRDDAMDLIATSARKLVDLLSFSRVAFGSAAGAEAFDTNELGKLARGIYAHVRAELDWAVEPQSIAKPAARIALNLAQLAAGALPLGGVARLELKRDRGVMRLAVAARGPKARLHAEVAQGLAGEPLSEGLGGRWVQAYYLWSLTTGTGGRIEARPAEGVVDFVAKLPA
jgi:histidine phosphotransferase ChpT